MVSSQLPFLAYFESCSCRIKRKFYQNLDNKKSQNFDEDTWKHNYKFFLKIFLLKNTCFFMIFIIASNRWNRAEVGKILELVLVLPATNVTSDRNFSKMKLIKNPIRSTMSHECLNHCMIFSTHKEKVDKLKNLQN